MGERVLAGRALYGMQHLLNRGDEYGDSSGSGVVKE